MTQVGKVIERSLEEVVGACILSLLFCFVRGSKLERR